MVREDFANYKVSDLHQVKGKLNQIGYHSILQHRTIPSRVRFVAQGLLLMQDNDHEDITNHADSTKKIKQKTPQANN